MKSLFLAVCIIAGVAHAQQMGTVVQAQPTFEQVNTGSSCQQGGYQQNGNQGRSNTGAILGGISGAGIGNGIGQGDGRVAAMAIFSAVGAIVGDRLDNQPQQYQNQCRNAPQYEQRQSGTQIVVDFQGRRVNGYIRRAVQIGDQVRVNVNVSIAE